MKQEANMNYEWNMYIFFSNQFVVVMWCNFGFEASVEPEVNENYENPTQEETKRPKPLPCFSEELLNTTVRVATSQVNYVLLCILIPRHSNA